MKLTILTILFLITNLCMASSDAYQEIDKLIASNSINEAFAKVETGLKAAPKDLEFLMRKSRILTLQADQIKDEDKKVATYEKAKKVADKMIEIDDKSAKGYLRRAIAKGKLILFKGILQSRALVLDLRKDAKKALELSSATVYDKALANYLLGRAHLKLAAKPKVIRLPLGLGWASKKKGGAFLKKAAQGHPSTIAFNYDYALYLKDNGDKSSAKKLLQKIDTLAVSDPSDVGRKAQAKKLLAEI